MNAFVAKKASLNVMRECQGSKCTCFTDKGYYIQYRGKNIDSMLFICRDCYTKYYKAHSIPGTFDEEKYQSNRKQRYYGNPSIRKFFRGFHRGIRSARIVYIILAVLLITAFCLKEQPRFRTEYPSREIYIAFNSNIRGVEGISTAVEKLVSRITKNSNQNGGSKDD